MVNQQRDDTAVAPPSQWRFRMGVSGLPAGTLIEPSIGNTVENDAELLISTCTTKVELNDRCEQRILR